MKLLIRSSLLASVLALAVAVPVFAEPGSTTHGSTSTCRTDESTGMTYVREHDTVQLASDGSADYMKINLQLSEEITDGGVTWCIRTHVVIRGDSERLNKSSATPGPC